MTSIFCAPVVHYGAVMIIYVLVREVIVVSTPHSITSISSASVGNPSPSIVTLYPPLEPPDEGVTASKLIVTSIGSTD
jgi:hypothetical protein